MPIQKQNVTLFLPALGILALYLFTRLFSMESGLEETAAALLGFGALACFAHGERLASDPARSLKQSIFWGFLGAVLPFVSTELVLYQNLEILTPLFGEGHAAAAGPVLCRGHLCPDFHGRKRKG